MKVDVERIDGNKVALTVEVEAERVESAIANVLVDTRRRVTLPGFRKGKAPRALLERYIGLEVLCQEAQQELLPEAFQEAVQEAAIEPVDVEFDVSDLQPNESFRFKAIVEVKPEINLPDFRAYDIEMEQASVSDEDVEQALQRLQEQHAVLRSVPEDTPAAQGHQVIIDYSAQTADGEPQRRENVPLMLGSGVFPEFEEQIVGLRTGEEKEFTLSVPKSEGEAEDVEENEVTYQIRKSKRRSSRQWMTDLPLLLVSLPRCRNCEMISRIGLRKRRLLRLKPNLRNRYWSESSKRLSFLYRVSCWNNRKIV
jgi:trigger factor